MSPMSTSRNVPAVVVDGVSKTFSIPHEERHTLKERVLHPFRRIRSDHLEALKEVSFRVEQGEFFGIVGKNGSGKSTLLKCLAGIYKTDCGRIYVNGRMSTFIELGVGFNPDLAARDNVLLNAIMLGVPVREARARFDEIIAFAELEDFVDLKIKNYSSGMLVRLAFATAIQAHADILLIDEVLAVGDAAFQQKCFDVFNNLRDEGRTILFVTHDMGTVTRFCHRALLMHRGRVVEIGEPEQIAEQYLELNFGKRLVEASRHGAGVRSHTGETEILEGWLEDADGQRRSSFMTSEQCVAKIRVRIKAELEEPNFHFSWLNEQDVPVFVASNATQKEGIGGFSSDDIAVVELAFRPMLAPGRYYVNVWISRRGAGHEILERWERMFSMLVTATSAGGGIAELPYELTVARWDQARRELEAAS